MIVLTWVPLFVSHFLIVKRATRITVSSAISEYNRNLVALVSFVLILALYTVVCTVTMFACRHDRENARPEITLSAEVIWLFSPVIAALSVVKVNRSLYPGCFHLIPLTKTDIHTCVKRAFVFGIPLCLVYAVGDQLLRQVISFAATQDASNPVPMRREFLDSVGYAFGYSGDSGAVSMLLAFVSNLSIGPVVDFFAAANDSVYEYSNAASTGVALYLLYAIPEEVGWTGTLYPMLLTHFSPTTRSTPLVRPVVKAMTVTGIVWGLWHCPFIILKWNPAIDALSSFVYNLLFLLSCIATRFVLISLVWPLAGSPNSHLLEGGSTQARPVGKSPSLFPAIWAHAAMNAWWSFYTNLYDWHAVPTWSILVGAEFSILAVVWQMGIAFLLVRTSFRKRSSPRPEDDTVATTT